MSPRSEVSNKKLKNHKFIQSFLIKNTYTAVSVFSLFADLEGLSITSKVLPYPVEEKYFHEFFEISLDPWTKSKQAHGLPWVGHQTGWYLCLLLFSREKSWPDKEGHFSFGVFGEGFYGVWESLQHDIILGSSHCCFPFSSTIKISSSRNFSALYLFSGKSELAMPIHILIRSQCPIFEQQSIYNSR